ncbi:MAG: hypothetical protein H6741_05725 [Alphaproteobacteria bacterium]|nr:hypothetical protein [Alphaproteobacteria bacterium]MCB9792206.1 hypothetical protein [Alphaproteobacteria bacterium]
MKSLAARSQDRTRRDPTPAPAQGGGLSNSEAMEQLRSGQGGGDGNQDMIARFKEMTASGGQPVPHQDEMERLFGQPLSGLSAWLGMGDALHDMGMDAGECDGALAFASSSPDKDQVAHEITHALQGGGQGLSRPGDGAEREAEAAGQAARSGGTVDVQSGGTGQLHGDWLDSIGDALGLRENEAALDEWEDYQDAMEAYREFVGQTHSTTDFQSSTDIGFFDASWSAGTGTLVVTVKCRFTFSNSSAADFPSATPEQLAWAEEDKATWKSDWMAQVSAAWSGTHSFHCQEDWWEDLSAGVQVQFTEVESGEHYHCDIRKIPPGESRQSSVRSGNPGWFGRSPGYGNFDSNDMEEKWGAGTQRGSIHEAGHMLGLDDEYTDACTDHPSHSDLADDALGDEVECGNDGRIMSTGTQVQPEHGVTFLEALKDATDKKWGYTAKEPRPVPHNPNAVEGDFPLPGDSDTAYA